VYVYLTKWMARFTWHERISKTGLHDAIARAEQGLIDADLGGGLIKQRVARQGKGRSGGYRTIVAYQRGSRAVFLYGFAKSERENIGPDELAELRIIGSNWLAASNAAIVKALHQNDLEEVGQ
jgi:hypothetical protein